MVRVSLEKHVKTNDTKLKITCHEIQSRHLFHTKYFSLVAIKTL